MDVPRRDDLSRAKLSARVARTCRKSARIGGRKRDEAENAEEKKRKKKKKTGWTLSDFSCSFSANFRRPINRKAGQEDASECDEEDMSPIRVEEEEDEEEERERQERGVVDGGRGRKKDERWRSATGRQNLLDRHEALQM